MVAHVVQIPYHDPQTHTPHQNSEHPKENLPPRTHRSGTTSRFSAVIGHTRRILPNRRALYKPPSFHSPRNFRCAIVRDFVATRYRNASAASSPPTPSSSASTISTSSGRFGSCRSAGSVSISRPQLRLLHPPHRQPRSKGGGPGSAAKKFALLGRCGRQTCESV